MGVAYYPVFEQQIVDFDPSVKMSGKSIARNREALDKICVTLGQADIFSFYSESNEESFATIGEEVPAGLVAIPIVWSEPAAGLATVEALRNYLIHHPNELEENQNVLKDLQDFHLILTKAHETRTKFRLRIDM